MLIILTQEYLWNSISYAYYEQLLKGLQPAAMDRS